jgi:nucleoside-diphosphate-sugar epimerase
MGLRIAVLGGTRFIGRRIVDELVEAGHDVLVVHRGKTEPEGLPDVPHLHADRLSLGNALDDFDPEAVLDCAAFGAADAEAVLAALPGDERRLVVLSSMDVYRAYGSVHAGTVSDAVPLDETSPVRPERFPYRGQMPGMDDYEKLEVEERWLARGATVCRLPMVIGEHDYQRRQELVLRRVRAGRERIPIGTGTALLTHGYVGDVARGVRLVLEADDAIVRGEVFNFGERRTPTMALRARQILDAAGAPGTELVTVPDDALPPDLGVLGTIPQPLLVSSDKARALLGWDESDPDEALRRTVEWHLANPPERDGDDQASDEDFSADDAALERAVTSDASP